ncbi:MAG: hypothetical protein WC449_00820 [Candidatus Paceibacterota bacterium]
MENKIGKIKAAVDSVIKSQKHWKAKSKQVAEKQVLLELGHSDPEKRMTKFYEGMAAMAATGMMKGYTPQRIQGMRSERAKLIPEEYDYTALLTIIECGDKKIAKQMLQNQALMPQMGFNAPAPGAPNGQSFLDIIKSQMKGRISPAQMKQLEEASKKSQEQFAKSKNKAGIGFKIGKYKGFDAVFLKSNKFKEACQALSIGNYLLSGSLLGLPEALPPGSQPCFAIGKQPGMGEKPNSTIASQGYAYKEEAQEMVEKIIAAVAKLAK